MIEVKVRTVYPQSGDGFHGIVVSVGEETLYDWRVPCNLEDAIREMQATAENMAMVALLTLKGAGVEAKVVQEEFVL